MVTSFRFAVRTVTLACMAVVFASTPVFALSSEITNISPSPNNSYTQGVGGTQKVVHRIRWNQNGFHSILHLRAYFDTQTPNATVSFAPPTSPGMTAPCSQYLNSGYSLDTTIVVVQIGTFEAGRISARNLCTSAGLYRSFGIPNSQVMLDPDTEKFATSIVVKYINTAALNPTIEPGRRNAIGMYVNLNRGMVGPVGGNDYRYSILGDENAGMITSPYTSTLPFGLSCTIKTEVIGTFTFYDPDPSGFPDKPAFEVYYMDTQTRVDLSRPVSGNLSPDSKRFVPNDQRQTATISMVLEPGKKYVLKISNISPSNTMDLGLPNMTTAGNGIYTCPIPTAPTAVITPLIWESPVDSVLQGDSVTFRYGWNTTGSDFGYIDFKRRTWLDKTGDRLITPDDGMIDQDATYSGSHHFSTGTHSLDPWTISKAAQGGYVYVCSSLEFKVGTPPPGTPIVNVVIPAPQYAVKCVPIAKKPSMRIEGGDVRAGGVYPSTGGDCTIGDNYKVSRIVGSDYEMYPNKNDFGSTGDLGVFAPGHVTQFGSFMNKSFHAPQGQNTIFGNGEWSYATTLYPGGYGGQYDGFWNVDRYAWVNKTWCLPDAYSAYRSTSVEQVEVVDQPYVDITTSRRYNLENGTAQALRLCSPDGCGRDAVIRSGQQVVIDVRNGGQSAQKTIIIGSNVSYSTPVGNVGEIPQLIILTDEVTDVRFDKNVTRFDGLIISQHGIFTCVDEAGILSDPYVSFKDPTLLPGMDYSKCNQQLTINGSLVTSRIVRPNRTAGNGKTTEPAESINLTPELLISDYVSAQKKQGMTTVSQQELPPRF